MTDPGQSLLDAVPLALPMDSGSGSSGHLPAESGEHTGEFLFLRCPEVYGEITRALAAGESRKSIARRLGVSRNTVAAVYRRESRSLTAEQMKHAHARELRLLAAGAADRAREILDSDTWSPSSRDLQALAVSAAVFIDKAELLSGSATARVEIVAAPSEDEYAEALRRARAARVVDVECVDTRIEVVPGGQKAAPAAELAPAAGGLGAAVGVDPAAGADGRDAGSVDSLSVAGCRKSLPDNASIAGDVCGDGGNVSRQVQNPVGAGRVEGVDRAPGTRAAQGGEGVTRAGEGLSVTMSQGSQNLEQRSSE